jgi:hypothetical protein
MQITFEEMETRYGSPLAYQSIPKPACGTLSTLRTIKARAMKPTDFRLLCMALGFTAVVLQGDKIPKQHGALRAAALADLIGAFCQAAVPEAFEDAAYGKHGPAGSKESERTIATAQRMATAIIEIMRETGGCLPQDVIARGFTPGEVERHWPMAKGFAHVELKIMDA